MRGSRLGILGLGLGLGLACGESLSLTNTVGDDAGTGDAALTDEASERDQSANPVPPDSGLDAAIPFSCAPNAMNLFCTDFETQPIENEGEARSFAEGGLFRDEAASVSPTHSFLSIAPFRESIATFNVNVPKDTTPFEVEFSYRPEAGEEGAASRIATLNLSKKLTGGGASVVRIIGTQKAGAYAISVTDLTTTPLFELDAVPIGEWRQFRLRATRLDQSGFSWSVNVDLNGQNATRTVNVTTPATTVAYNIEIGADKGGFDAGVVTARFDNVRIRQF